MEMEPLTPGLYIVATPIGNLRDVSARAADVLARADLIAAEDTRVTAKLLRHLGLKRPMMPYHEHSDEAARARLIARMSSGSVALVSDAGTPLISDPGYKLVRAARAAGANVVTIPGPCAAVAALTLAGLPTDRFLFAGFLSTKAAGRDTEIAELAAVRATLLFYESGSRLARTLVALAAGLGDRPAAVAREITKLHEECVTGTLAELSVRYSDAHPKGEIVIVVGPPRPPAASTTDEIDAALAALPADAPLKAASADIAGRLGLPRRKVYTLLLSLRGNTRQSE